MTTMTPERLRADCRAVLEDLSDETLPEVLEWLQDRLIWHRQQLTAIVEPPVPRKREGLIVRRKPIGGW